MLNMYGGQGLGSNGSGLSGGGGGIPLQQVLAALQGGGGQMTPNPFQQGQGTATSPMSAFIGHPMMGGGGMPGGGMHPGMPPVAGGQPGQMSPSDAVNQTSNLMKMLAQLRGGQTGVAPNGMPGQAVGPGGAGTPGVGGMPGMPGPSAGQVGQIAHGMSPDTMAQQMTSMQPIGQAGSPTAALPPTQMQGAPGIPPGQQSQMNPGLLAWLHQMLGGGAPAQ